MKNLIKVIEKEHKNERGNIVAFTYHSPTHWNSEGFCRIYDNFGKWSFSSSSGGTNDDFSPLLVVNAMSQGFELAQKRLITLTKWEN